MRRIRDDAAQFRRDYQNWRKGANKGAKGARGITTVTEGTVKIAHNPLTELTASQKSYPLQRRNLAKIAALGKLKVPLLQSPQTNSIFSSFGCWAVSLAVTKPT